MSVCVYVLILSCDMKVHKNETREKHKKNQSHKKNNSFPIKRAKADKLKRGDKRWISLAHAHKTKIRREIYIIKNERVKLYIKRKTK